MKLPKGLKVLKEPIKDNAGEPIYPIGYMCDYEGCHNKGERFETVDGPIWFCAEHQKPIEITMENKKITLDQFERLFKIKPFKGKFDCYGTWNGLDMYELADSPENARIAMWEKLKKANWI